MADKEWKSRRAQKARVIPGIDDSVVEGSETADVDGLVEKWIKSSFLKEVNGQK